MAVNDMRLRVVLDLVERVVAPLKRVTGGSTQAAQALKATRERLKELNQQQTLIGDWRTMRAGLSSTSAELARAQARVTALAGSINGASPPTKAMTREFRQATKEAAALGERHQRQAQQVQQLRDKLNAAGISTRSLSTHERELRGNIASTTAEITRQTSAMQAQATQQRKLVALRERHGKEMLHAGMLAAGGKAVSAAGRSAAGPLRSMASAYMTAETSEAQLSASMMRPDGSVVPEFKQILELATRLGDRLPGTTADFIDMMTMLRRQGMSEKSILGGLGESAAYLGVQLRMPVTAAAEFAAKMQDATQTAETDMMGLMDVIQRAYYLGVDAPNMLQGFTKMGAVMPFLGKKGLEASQMLAPMLVMMDQAGMAGESAGNAIRKVVQLSLDSDKLTKANKLLKPQGVQLNFADKQGKFAGIENLFEQLKKLKGITSDVQRIAVMKKLFGDDAETHQVLNTLMEKGIDGYHEVMQKMQQQADLRKRVDGQLKTVAATMEAAQGSFTNMLKDMGATIAPDLVKLLNWLGELASKTGAWVRENPEVVKWGLRIVGVFAGLAIGAGSLAVALASFLGPMLLARFLFARVSLGMFNMASLARGAGTALSWLWGMLLRGGGLLMGVGRWLWGIGGTLVRLIPVVLRFLGPWGMIASAVIAAATAIWANWDTLGPRFAGWWATVKAGFMVGLNFLLGLPGRFMAAGAAIVQGVVDGITSRLAAVRDTVLGVAESISSWFREKLGINSPSRVFMQYGGWISEGAALGIQGGQGAVRNAALAMATAATSAMPAIAAPGMARLDSLPQLPALTAAANIAMPPMAEPGMVRFDSRPPLSATSTAAPARAAGGSTTIQITINAAPGQDERAIARAVAAELDRRERSQRSRVLSQLSDID